MPEGEPRFDRIALRPERPDDAPFLRRLFEDTHGGILAGLDAGLAGTLLAQQFAGQTMTYRTRFPGASFDVVLADGVPVGRIVVDRSEDVFRIVDIALLAAWRGQGVGTSMLRAILSEAAAAGSPVDLCVTPGNAAAHQLYVRLGFTTVAASPTTVDMRWQSDGTASAVSASADPDARTKLGRRAPFDPLSRTP